MSLFSAKIERKLGSFKEVLEGKKCSGDCRKEKECQTIKFKIFKYSVHEFILLRILM